ncbi:hypothetical protein RFI_04928 [Reticulomyxa filosa]|uniref:Uncharacterized protein n=1 Tax=Reticulomyxa filosa TaxID=46433 RepID=X6P224_RETFI|nr:hypothetical protein RFI_04928 [Reticulomyxa filosa]|eukprot:ETO32188.1 hypothetical protein RFI_04928 [Reticulomyxa filosa]
MTTFSNEKETLTQPAFTRSEEEINLIIQHWIRILHIRFGWVHDLNKFVFNYVSLFIYLFFIQMSNIYLILYNTDDHNLHTVRVWDLDNNEHIQLFTGHLRTVHCVKFSLYHYYNHHRNVVCSSSNTIRFWDFKNNRQLQIFDKHTGSIRGIAFSRFNSCRYLCSGSFDNTVRLWDVETSESLHVFNGHEDYVRCIDISPLQSNNNINMIGGNGYTICSGSDDKTIRIWDIETFKPLTVFKGHTYWVRSVKYGSNKLGSICSANIILSCSEDKFVCLWDIRSGKQIQKFHGHTHGVTCVEYSPFVIDIKFSGSSSNVICSGSIDNTIRFWDIRSNKGELYVIKGYDSDHGISCFKFISLGENKKTNNIHLCYGSHNGPVHVWG